MSFYKTVRLLEGQMVLDNFKLILPLDYEEIIVRYPLLDKGKKKYIEWCKVKSPEKRGIGDYRSINVETIKHGYVDIPDEIKALKSYSEYARLSLCGLYCNTMQPTKYGYWYICGQMNIHSKNIKHTLEIIFGEMIDEMIDEVFIFITLKAI
jgi:hypothetical protein